MIRINLLSEGRRPVVARKAKPTLSLGGQDPIEATFNSGFWCFDLICSSVFQTLVPQISSAGRISTLSSIICR